MKTIIIVSAAVMLAACAHTRNGEKPIEPGVSGTSPNQPDHSDKTPTTDSYSLVGQAESQGLRVVVRPLTAEIKEFLDVPDAAMVVVPGHGNEVVFFKTPSTLGKKQHTVSYPVETKQVRAQFGISWTAYEGSCCFDMTTTWGGSSRACVNDPAQIRALESIGIQCT